MKKLVMVGLAICLAGAVGGTAQASFMNPVVSASLLVDYQHSLADYWTWADFTAPNTSMNSEFTIKFESASYESNFGLYMVDNYLNPTSVEKTFQIFAPSAEPGADKTVNVKVDSGVYYVTLDAANSTTANWTAFDNVFGFYFGVKNTGQTFFTDMRFNTVDKTLEHVSTFYADGYSKSLVFLDDQTGGGDRDFNDMVVKVTDVTPAPVPEPNTLLLLGAGLLGLGIFGRRKMKR